MAEEVDRIADEAAVRIVAITKQPLDQLDAYIRDANKLNTYFYRGVIAVAYEYRNEGNYDEAKKLLDGSDSHLELHYRHSLVGLWSALESTIEDYVVTWLLHEPRLLSKAVAENKKIHDIKIALGEYEQLDQRGKMLFIVREAGTKKSGYQQLEAVLEMIGLSGLIPDDIRTALFELHHIRNVIVHRGSVVDRQFAKECAHLGYAPNERIRISDNDWDKYSDAVSTYCKIIIDRTVLFVQQLYFPSTEPIEISIFDADALRKIEETKATRQSGL